MCILKGRGSNSYLRIFMNDLRVCRFNVKLLDVIYHCPSSYKGLEFIEFPISLMAEYVDYGLV